MTVALDCVDPGTVQDWELEAHADGESLPHVAEHLERCPACRTRLEKMMVLEHRLRQTLYRFDCPSPDALRDYHWGYLPASERRQIETHLETCPLCATELADLAGFVAAERTQAPGALLDRARQAAEQVHLVIACLVSPVPQPLPALRGETQEVLLFDAGDVALSLNLEQEDTGAYTLFGQVLSPEQASHSGYARLTARAAGIAPVQSPLDANGGFALVDLRPGVYQLVVSLPERRVVVPALALRTEV